MMKSAFSRAAVGAVALAGVVALGASPAHANPAWTLYNEGTAAPLTSSDTVSGTGSIVIAATIAGVPRTITCAFTSANPLSLSTTGPFSGLPGGTLSVSLAVPSAVTCTSGALSVPVTITGPWSVDFTLPAAGTTAGQLYNGTLSGSVNVPANSVHADLGAFATGCTSVGPTVAKAFTGSYNASTGAVAATANQTFNQTPSGCVVTASRLASASITANPVIDLQW